MKGPKFLMAMLLSGESIVAEFSALAGSGQGYATQVFAGAKPFNAWRVVGGAHPANGEPVLIRTRVMYSGAQIAAIWQVKPVAGKENTHGYEPLNFEPVTEIQHGQYGMFVMPAGIEGGAEGVEYPIHRDNDSLRRYIVLRAAYGSDAELRHYIDADGVRSVEPSVGEARNVSDAPGDADDDLDAEF